MYLFKHLYLFLIFSILLCSCSSVIRVNKFDQETRPPNNGKLDVYSHAQAVPYLYKEIGLITVDDEGWGHSESSLLDQAIQKAKEMGANGLIILSQDKQLDGFVPVGGVSVAANRQIVRASAIIKTGEKTKETAQTQSHLSVADELLKLKKLKDNGVLTNEEYELQKKKLLSK